MLPQYKVICFSRVENCAVVTFEKLLEITAEGVLFYLCKNKKKFLLQKRGQALALAAQGSG